MAVGWYGLGDLLALFMYNSIHVHEAASNSCFF